MRKKTTMKLPAKINELINLATERGLYVTERNSSVTIRTGKTQRSRGIVIWDNGTANRTDCDLSVATSIKSVQVMKEILGLTSKGV